MFGASSRLRGLLLPVAVLRRPLQPIMILILSGSTLGDVTNEPLKKLTYSIPTYIYDYVIHTCMHPVSLVL